MSTPLVRIATVDDPLRVGVLASGSGSNLQALLDFGAERRSDQNDARDHAPAFRVVVVVVNVDGAFALQRAATAGVATALIPHKGLSRDEHEGRVAAALAEHDVELVVLAGYMRVLTGGFVGRFKRRIVNVHPALLPSFPGMHGAKQALDHGCRVAGCTVHLVDDGVDTGPILTQGAVPVEDDDTEETLQKRIQTQEHRLLPRVVAAIADGRVVDDGQRLRLRGGV